jgi:hypothetical protein
MKRYLLWANIPGMLLGAALQQWFGLFGIILATILLVVVYFIWMRFDGSGKN